MNFKTTILIACGFVVSIAAFSCSCEKTPTTKEEYSRSDLVIEGKVISFDTITTGDEVFLRFKIVIVKDFKTTYKESDTVYVLTSPSISGCRYPFIPTQDYLIYADKAEFNDKRKKRKENQIEYKDKTFVTSICRLTQMSNNEEKKRIEELAR